MIAAFCADCARVRDPGEDVTDWLMGVDGEDWLGVCPECVDLMMEQQP
jgi:hypothetical protein